ncbi:hypothetical protein [Nocardia sp. NPDC051981]|uniref:hypothetical protein n=1 Tax=Nocardia sp. NPDC051981 TaxID=3155417 RepID=UPI00342FE67E
MTALPEATVITRYPPHVLGENHAHIHSVDMFPAEKTTEKIAARRLNKNEPDLT